MQAVSVLTCIDCLLPDVPLPVQRSGAQVIREVLSVCSASTHGKLMKDLVTLACKMLANFSIMYNEYGFEKTWTRDPPIADLLDLEGETPPSIHHSNSHLMYCP